MSTLSPVTDNCSSLISGRERMAVQIISWPISMKECCRTWGSNPRPSAYQADAHPIELPLRLRKSWNDGFLINYCSLWYKSWCTQSTKISTWSFMSIKGQGHSLILGQFNRIQYFQLLFLKVTADFNISSALRWAIKDQWSSGYLFTFLFILTVFYFIFQSTTTLV